MIIIYIFLYFTILNRDMARERKGGYQKVLWVPFRFEALDIHRRGHKVLWEVIWYEALGIYCRGQKVL